MGADSDAAERGNEEAAQASPLACLAAPAGASCAEGIADTPGEVPGRPHPPAVAACLLAALTAAPPLPPASAAPPAQPPHAKKPSVDELFEHRWRKAYEVRALERESRQARSQPGSRRGSSDMQGSSGAVAADKPAVAGGTVASAAAATGETQHKHAPVTVHVGAGTVAAAAVSKLSLLATASCADGQAAGAERGEAAAAGEQVQRLRQQEIVDDDEDDAGGGAAGTAEATAAAPRSQQPAATDAQRRQQGVEGEEEEEEEDGSVTYVWDSSSRRPGAAMQPQPADGGGDGAGRAAAQHKERGNALFKAGDFEGALRCYAEGLAALEQDAAPAAGGMGAAEAAGAGDSGRSQLLATLHSNRAHALLKLHRGEEAATAALQAHRLHPTWPKPLYRLAQARLALGHWAAAVAACKKGDGLAPKSSEGHTEFTPLWDRVAVQAARAGSLVGFDGQQLEVRSAGPEAWLGRPAPHVLELDGPEDEDALGPATTLAPPSAAPGAGGAGPGAGAGGHGGDALVSWDYRQTAAVAQRRRTSFRSIKEAVAAARDGDRILLLRGTHNGMGESITVTKRLLVQGEGALGEAVIDQRANCPTFRILRGGVVLRTVDLDQTGFREALLVEGPASVHPLIQDCRLRCSGDDAVNTSGAAAPTFLGCAISAKKVGLKACGSSAPRLERCSLDKCGEQGVRAMEASAPQLHSCTIAECEEEAVVGMEQARVTLRACMLRACKGPGVDLSGTAQATIIRSSVEGCVGGVWAWEGARAALRGASMAGGPSHAILADGEAQVEVRESTVKGSVHATEGAWAGILHASNTMLDPEGPTDFPPEEGPFRFVPNRYTRKQ